MVDHNFSGSDDKNYTSSALLEQLVYIDNFMNKSTDSSGELTPNLDIDGQLSIDLAAFVDDSFVFPDEEKPQMPAESPKNDFSDTRNDLHNINDLDSSLSKLESFGVKTPMVHFDSAPQSNINISTLPKFPVPPGAKSSLESAGLSQNQIDLLSALVAQHQMGDQTKRQESTTSKNLQFNSPVRQHNHIRTGSQSGSSSVSSVSNFDLNASNSIYDGGFKHQEAGYQSMLNLTSTQEQAQISSHTPSQIQTQSQIQTSSKADDNKEISETDKRRRNTAASARFRIKKKLKEKQMENQIIRLNDLIENFETKIQQLDMENKLLKNLIMEKGTQKSDHELKLLKERAKLG